ncbi:MAG: hypothetical protein ABJB16_16395 [Saprospiraceae bacterium]
MVCDVHKGKFGCIHQNIPLLLMQVKTKDHALFRCRDCPASFGCRSLCEGIFLRVVIAVLWFLTHWFNGVFDSILWLVLGFIFTPFNTLWYSSVVNH